MPMISRNNITIQKPKKTPEEVFKYATKLFQNKKYNMARHFCKKNWEANKHMQSFFGYGMACWAEAIDVNIAQRPQEQSDIAQQSSNQAQIKLVQEKAVRVMGSQLMSDLKKMENFEPCSLCAKWTPTEGDSVDRKFGVFKTLANDMKISPKTLRTMYNTPLRAYLKIVEKSMCSGAWDTIDFNKVPSQAMKKLKKAFEKHTPESFTVWKKALEAGDNKVKVNAKQLHPHQLITEVRTKGHNEVTEAQWRVLVEEVKKLGSFKDYVAVIDVSSSMHSPNYLPLDVAIAMGLIISEVVEGAFHGHVITFETNPSFQCIPKGKLHERFTKMHRMPWGGSTNIEGVFKLILDRAKAFELKVEDMPKKLIIVSDMQFNMATNANQTNMQRIEEMYKASGYTRPQIVFWNVNGYTTDFPVTTSDNGVCLISGFSPDILKSLLDGETYNPVGILRKTLDHTRYDKVRQALSMGGAMASTVLRNSVYTESNNVSSNSSTPPASEISPCTITTSTTTPVTTNTTIADEEFEIVN